MVIGGLSGAVIVRGKSTKIGIDAIGFIEKVYIVRQIACEA